jgi:hypothetical protein
MLRNLLDAVTGSSTLQHVSLVTGLKDYLGSFESYGSSKAETPFREDEPRQPGLNFYYVQEDILFEEAAKHHLSWNVQRPHTIIGYAVGNVMNMGVTLAVYGSLCRMFKRPFVFPASLRQYESPTDVTDASLLAKHLLWAGTTETAEHQAFNVVNGEIFRWRWFWLKLAQFFEAEAIGYRGQKAPCARIASFLNPGLFPSCEKVEERADEQKVVLTGRATSSTTYDNRDRLNTCLKE